MYMIKVQNEKSYFEGIQLGITWWTSRIDDAKRYERRKDAKEIMDRLTQNRCRLKMEIVKEG